MDLVKKLKDAPQGTILYCPMIGNMKFSHTDTDLYYPIYTISVCSENVYSFTKEGKYYNEEDGECVLFPSKDNRDWNNVSFKKDLPIGTPVVVFDVIYGDAHTHLYNIIIRYYAGKGKAFNDGYNSCNNHGETKWKYVIPVDEFDFKNASFNECDSYGSITW